MKEKIPLLPEQMKAIARYETDFSEWVSVLEDESDLCDIFSVTEKYQFTLEDLSAAYRNLKEKNPTINAFSNNWWFPLSELEEAFNISIACGEGVGINYDQNISPDCVRGLPLSPEECFSCLWYDLDQCCSIMYEDEHISAIPAFQEGLRSSGWYLEDRDKPVIERRFTDGDKDFYIGCFDSDERLNTASELEVQLCRKFTEELCEKDHVAALRLKGYACYGGNRLYPCDWHVSRDCMLRLYEKTDDPFYANTLGYIYYYGRCTGGKPEYEKAFEMFTVSAANGIHEGIYKLADMFRHGYACKKSPKTVKHLYGMVYNDTRRKFINGEDNAFADAALRMGNVYLLGIDAPVDEKKAYSCYLQADLAHRRRMEHSNFFGDTTVAINIRKALNEEKAALDENFFQEYIEEICPREIFSFLEDHYRISVCVEKLDNHDADIRIKRIPFHRNQTVQPVLITLPELDRCELTDEITFRGFNIHTSFCPEEDGPVIADDVEWNYGEERVEFFCADVLVGWIACEAYRLYPHAKTEPSGKRIRLASIRFQEEGRTYDYLCDDETIQAGHKVIVPGYDGETTVEVVRVYTLYESELGLPMERYKKVIGKAFETQKQD